MKGTVIFVLSNKNLYEFVINITLRFNVYRKSPMCETMLHKHAGINADKFDSQ